MREITRKGKKDQKGQDIEKKKRVKRVAKERYNYLKFILWLSNTCLALTAIIVLLYEDYLP